MLENARKTSYMTTEYKIDDGPIVKDQAGVPIRLTEVVA